MRVCATPVQDGRVYKELEFKGCENLWTLPSKHVSTLYMPAAICGSGALSPWCTQHQRVTLENTRREQYNNIIIKPNTLKRIDIYIDTIVLPQW